MEVTAHLLFKMVDQAVVTDFHHPDIKVGPWVKDTQVVKKIGVLHLVVVVAAVPEVPVEMRLVFMAVMVVLAWTIRIFSEPLTVTRDGLHPVAVVVYLLIILDYLKTLVQHRSVEEVMVITTPYL